MVVSLEEDLAKPGLTHRVVLGIEGIEPDTKINRRSKQ